jgi:hypothetical protein
MNNFNLGNNNFKINIKTGYNISSLSNKKGFLLEHTCNMDIYGLSGGNNYMSSESKILRFVIIFNSTKMKSGGLHGKFNKIIVSDSYSVFNKKIIVKSKINMDANYIDFVCHFGRTDILEMWKNKNTHPPHIHSYSSETLSIASYRGHVNVLEWWKNSGLFLKYYNDSLLGPCRCGHINVLEWWKNSGLQLKYDKSTLNIASYYGHINVLDWWKNSGLQLIYDEYAMDNASGNNQVDVLDWWVNSGLELRYSSSALVWASDEGNIKVLQWWKNSKLKFNNFIFASAFSPKKNKIFVKKFWKKLGVDINIF